MSTDRHWLRPAGTIVVLAMLYGCWRTEPSPQNSNVVAHLMPAVLFGWIRFAGRVFPGVNIAFAPVAFAILVAAITWALLYFGGRRLWGWSWRTPLVLVCAPALLFAIVLAAAGIHARVAEISPDIQLHQHYRTLRLPSEIFEVNFDKGEQNDGSGR